MEGVVYLLGAFITLTAGFRHREKIQEALPLEMVPAVCLVTLIAWPITWFVWLAWTIANFKRKVKK
jgi:hypothetical protein